MFPNLAHVQMEVRTSTSDLNCQRAVDIFQGLVEELGGEFELEKKVHSYSELFTPSDKLGLIEEAISNVGLEVIYLNESGYYDAEMFSKASNIPSIALGPGPNSMSHKDKEYVFINDLKKVEQIYREILKLYNIC